MLGLGKLYVAKNPKEDSVSQAQKAYADWPLLVQADRWEGVVLARSLPRLGR